jgi:D-3-phosphoglycerate dehydrogenase
VNCPLNEATYHLLGREQLELLKPTAILVNTARGKIIDERALADVLGDEKFFGAGLDVYEEEPLNRDSPLRRLDNVVLTNHISPLTREAMSETRRSSIRNILRFIKGERPHWVVNPSAFNIQR